MKILTILIGILGLFNLALFTLAIKRRRLNQTTKRLVAELLAESTPHSGTVFSSAGLEGLPEPVQRYLTKVIPEGQPYVKTVRLHQTGEFRLGDRTSPWKPFTAEQHFTVNPPGFVWDATIMMTPLIPVRVIDMYKEGEGALKAKVLSTLTVADAESRPEVNSGELVRYLSECVWFPTALLPGQGVEWIPINNHSATATIEHEGTRASVTFYFDDRDQVNRIHADRWHRKNEGDFELIPWTGYWRNYQIRNGLLIPTEGEVEWNLPEGNFTYWRARIDGIDQNAVNNFTRHSEFQMDAKVLDV
jgi:hypothetical protein